MKMYKFQKYKIIFLITILCLIFIIPARYPKHQTEDFVVSDNTERTQVKEFQIEEKIFDNHPELKSTESLKKNFAAGSDICKNKNFYTPFEIEYCTWEYVKGKSIDDYKILENIRYYCLNSTQCEYNRRECIERIIYY